jgi:hypothetical protein
MSGARQDVDVLIYIDLPKAMAAGVKFYMSSNGVVLTRGVGESGVLPAVYFSRAVRRRGSTLEELPLLLHDSAAAAIAAATAAAAAAAAAAGVSIRGGGVGGGGGGGGGGGSAGPGAGGGVGRAAPGASTGASTGAGVDTAPVGDAEGGLAAPKKPRAGGAWSKGAPIGLFSGGARGSAAPHGGGGGAAAGAATGAARSPAPGSPRAPPGAAAGAPCPYQYLIVLDFEATCDTPSQTSPQEIIELPSVVVDTVCCLHVGRV